MKGALAWGALALLALGCSAPDYGALPAKCGDGACPQGYACVRGVCAKGDAPVPVTLKQFGNLRGFDLRMVAEDNSALVVWQTYAYSEEGQRFAGMRLFPDGTVSPEMVFVSTFQANDNVAEPFYDVLRSAPDQLLFAISASPLADDGDSASPRLTLYRVSLPPPGREDEPLISEAAWPEEIRLPTIGYGAVSRPKLVARAGGVELGYFQTRTALVDETQVALTLGELAIFRLGTDGLPRDVPCRSACCPADVCYQARDGQPVAVGVLDAFPLADRTWWILDNARPSALLVADSADEAALEVSSLPLLAVPVDGDSASLLYLSPSTREGEKLPTDEVAGPAQLQRLEFAAPPSGGTTTTTAIKQIGDDLPALRDSPRPIWLTRPDKSALLVTPGDELRATTIKVFLVDPARGSYQLAREIPRFGSAPLGGLSAAFVQGSVYVAWVDTLDDVATIRVAIVPMK
jgi:hypothetical protein